MAELIDRADDPDWRGTLRWQVRWTNPPGETPRHPGKSFRTRKEAVEFKQSLERTVASHGSVDVKSTSMTFEALAQRWWKTTTVLEPHTRRGYHRLLHGHVLPYFGALPQNTITRETVAEFIDAKLGPSKERPGGYNAKYVRDMVSIVSLVMKHGMDMRPPLRYDNPADRPGIKVRHKKRKAGDADLLSLADADKLAVNVRRTHRPLVWVLTYTGVRPAELCGLRVGDLDRERSTLHVRSTVNFIHRYGDVAAQTLVGPTKTSAGDRIIPIPDWLTTEITTMLDERAERIGRPMKDDDWMFTALRGGPLNPHKLRVTIMRPALIRARLNPNIRTYDVRHSAATAWIDDGVPAPIVAELMGHTDTRVQALVYHHPSDPALRLGVEAMERQRKKELKKAKKGTKRETKGKAKKHAQRDEDRTAQVVDLDARRNRSVLSQGGEG